MRVFSLVAALAIGLLACSLIGQERVCLNGNCPLPQRPMVQVEVKKPSTRTLQGVEYPVVESTYVWQESPVVVESRQVRQPVRRMLANRPVRGFLKRIFCR